MAKTNDTTFYLGRERIIISDGERKPGTRRAPDDVVLPRMARWRKKLFVVMSRNAGRPQPATPDCCHACRRRRRRRR